MRGWSRPGEAKGTTRGEVSLKIEAEQPPPGPGLASQRRARKPRQAGAGSCRGTRHAITGEGERPPAPRTHCVAVIKGGAVTPKYYTPELRLGAPVHVRTEQNQSEGWHFLTRCCGDGNVGDTSFRSFSPLALLTSEAGSFSGGPSWALWGAAASLATAPSMPGAPLVVTTTDVPRHSQCPLEQNLRPSWNFLIRRNCSEEVHLGEMQTAFLGTEMVHFELNSPDRKQKLVS